MTTLVSIFGEKEFESRFGTLVGINLSFENADGTAFNAQLSTKPETLLRRYDMLQKWMNTPSDEWAFEDKGSFDNGDPKPKKVVSYPGKAVGGVGGQQSYPDAGVQTASTPPAPSRSTVYQSPPDDRDASIRRAVALKAAVEYTTARGSTDLGSVYLAADAFDKWLQERPGRSHGGDGNGDSLQVPSTVPDVASDSGTTSPESGPGAGEGSSDIRGEADSDCPPHQLDMNSPPKAMGRRPCQKCGAFVRPAA